MRELKSKKQFINQFHPAKITAAWKAGTSSKKSRRFSILRQAPVLQSSKGAIAMSDGIGSIKTNEYGILCPPGSPGLDRSREQLKGIRAQRKYCARSNENGTVMHIFLVEELHKKEYLVWKLIPPDVCGSEIRAAYKGGFSFNPLERKKLMKDKKIGRFTFRTTPEDEKILAFISKIDNEDTSKILRRILKEYGVRKGFLTHIYGSELGVNHD